MRPSCFAVYFAKALEMNCWIRFKIPCLSLQSVSNASSINTCLPELLPSVVYCSVVALCSLFFGHCAPVESQMLLSHCYPVDVHVG